MKMKSLSKLSFAILAPLALVASSFTPIPGVTSVETAQAAPVSKSAYFLSEAVAPYGTEVKTNIQTNSTVKWAGFRTKPDNIYFQYKSGTRWVNLAKANLEKDQNGWGIVSPSVTALKAGNYTVRYHRDADATYKEWNSRSQTVTIKPIVGDIQLYRTTSKDLTWSTKTGRNFYAVINKGDHNLKRTVELQRYDGKKWIKVASTVAKGNDYADVLISNFKWKKAGKVTYRFYAPVVGGYSAIASKSFTVKYDDPNKYTGVAKTAYNYMKKYCPNATVSTFSSKQYDGLAWFGTNHIQIEKTLNKRSNKDRQKHVALHECAHILEGLPYTKQGYKDDTAVFKKAANKLTGRNNGSEILADCMSFRMGSSPKYASYYRKKCPTSWDNAAKKLLAGKRI